jgi:hypothetical protein
MILLCVCVCVCVYVCVSASLFVCLSVVSNKMVVDSLFSSSSLSSCDGKKKNQKSWDVWEMGIASC